MPPPPNDEIMDPATEAKADPPAKKMIFILTQEVTEVSPSYVIWPTSNAQQLIIQ